MVNLNWKGKSEASKKSVFNQENISFQVIESFKISNNDFHIGNSDGSKPNVLIGGDNEPILNFLLKDYSEKIQLIYIDPPFATGGDFNYKIQIGENKKVFNDIAYYDRWNNGLDSYLNFMFKRLILMKQLLTQTGSIFIHLDWHVSHYIKLLMDEIFGTENFRNEIIWAYPAASSQTKRFFMRSFDAILFYTKSDEYIFNDSPHLYMDYSKRVKNALKEDEKGTFYYRGGSHDGKKLSRKVYITKSGIFPRDVWNDIPYIRANTSEYQGFSTQKPERLLKRIILASTNKGDIVGDFFCGSGTTLAVAEKLGRRWIGTDINEHSIHITKKRMLAIDQTNDLFNWNEKYRTNCAAFTIYGLKNNINNENLQVYLLKDHIKVNEQIQHLEKPKFEIKIEKHGNKVRLELENYIIPFESDISKEMRENINNFSDWIDYWSVDFDFHGDVFNNYCVSYKTMKRSTITLLTDYYIYDKSKKLLLR
jgi:adenine specific DNA methylase Mod